MLYKYSEFLLEFKRRYDKSDRIEDFSDLYINKIAEKFNLKIIKKLGKGSFGIAYLTNDNRVIKVTGDKNEAKNARKLLDEDLTHFLNYYYVFEITLDGNESPNQEGFDSVYFILMDYVRPLNKDEKKYWQDLHVTFFSGMDDEEFLDDVYSEYGDTKLVNGKWVTDEDKANDGVEYFKQFIKQRGKMLDEGSDLGIEFSDAHSGNLGIKKDGTLVYFDIGYGDHVMAYDSEGGERELEIDKSDFKNDYKEIKKLITTDYKVGELIPLNELLNKISKSLKVNKINSYKYLRDEVWAYYEKSRQEMLIFFVANNGNGKNPDQNDDGSFKDPRESIIPSWVKQKLDIYVVYTEDYKITSIEKRKGMRKLKPKR